MLQIYFHNLVLVKLTHRTFLLQKEIHIGTIMVHKCGSDLIRHYVYPQKMLIILTLTTLTMSFSFAQFTKETKSAGGTLGWASTKKLPILFIVEDNNLSILTEKNFRNLFLFQVPAHREFVPFEYGCSLALNHLQD